MDYDVVNGTKEELRQWLGISPAPPTLEERVAKLEAQAHTH